MKSEISNESDAYRFFKRIGNYLPVVVILGVAVPALVYVLMMELMGWRLPGVGLQGAMPYVAPAGSNVILYAAPNTKTYLATIGGNHEMLLVPWRAYFADRKMDFKEVREPAQLRKYQSGVLVLPSALALGDNEREEILAFQERGGAILTSWATGTRQANGEWAGWSLLEKLGAKVLGEVSPGPEVNHLVLTGESPVSYGYPAGQRIGIGKTAESLLRLKGEMIGARFMNWARVPDTERRGEGAVVFSDANAPAGRTAFFGFAETAWESRPLGMYPLIDDTIQWLQRQPAVVLAAWPQGKRAAQILEMDTEDNFANALPFASMVHALDFPATFYVLTSEGKRHPHVLRQLASSFEIGYHGDVHVGFAGLSAAGQEERILNMRSEMSSVLADTTRITGFRAPTEGYDATTERLLQKSGIRHHATDPNRTDGRLPLLAKIDGIAKADTLVILPRTQRDDLNLSQAQLSVEQTSKALLDDFEHVVETGALGLLSVHSQNFGADGVLTKALPSLLVRMKQRRDQVWVATAGDVANWWRTRDNLKLAFTNPGKRMEFVITVTGTQPINGASLVMMLPQKGVLPTIQAIKISPIKPTVTKIDDYRASIAFDSIPPGNYEFQATFGR